jgi:hypothetical protein
MTCTKGTAEQLAEKVLLRSELSPQRLKPDSLQSIYVRPEGRTLQKHEFFRSLFSRAPIQSITAVTAATPSVLPTKLK